MPSKLPAYLGLGAAVCIWALAYVTSKVALSHFDPVFMVFARLFMAALLFIPATWSLRKIRPSRSDWLLLLLMALFEPCASFIFESFALSMTSASQGGMVAAILPVEVAIAAMLLLNERISGKAWLGLALSVGGVVWLSLGAVTTEQSPNPILGNFLEFLGVSAAVGNIILVKRLIPRYSPVLLTAFQTTLGALFYTPALLLPGVDLPSSFPTGPTLSLVFLGTVVTMGAYTLYNMSMTRLTASQSSAFINLVPVLTLIFGRLFLGEPFTLPQYLASALVLLGVWLTRTRTKEIIERFEG